MLLSSILIYLNSTICSKLFVRLIPPTITIDQLREYFAQYGTIRDSIFILDPNTSQPRGFGFVNFVNPSSLDRVIEDNSHCINDHWIGVDRCTLDGKREGFKSNRLYVYGIPPPLSSSDALAKFFGGYGQVIACSTDRGKCQGSIYFESSKSVDDVIAANQSWISLNGGVMMELSKYVLRRHPILLPRLRHLYKAVASGRGGDIAAQNPPQTAVYNPAGQNMTPSGGVVVNNQLWQPYGSYGNISGGGGANAMVSILQFPSSTGYEYSYYYAPPPTMYNPQYQYGIPSHYGYGGAQVGRYGGQNVVSRAGVFTQRASGYAGHYGGQNVLGSAGVYQEASGSATGYAGHYGGQNVVGSAGVSQEASGSGSGGGPLNATTRQADNSSSLFSYPMVTQGASGSGGSSNAKQDDNSNSLFSYEMVTKGDSGSGGASNARQDDDPDSLFPYPMFTEKGL
ncbi:hypothetical protein PIB30_028203 [Stylosanthes scabra]|uniref:RRM domain-containing protein n=1 Tax=Stylosanthes scabra TaxID=79078 RepID=A0ABU6SB56_9FABA|nr:hypothetical protein [Stylosanthes scabra]